MPLLTSQPARLIGRRGTTSRWLAGGIPAVNCIAAYEPLGAASLAASYVNLASPGTHDCTLGNAPTFATNMGWTGTGTHYLVTDIVPAAGWSAIVRFTNQTNSGYLFGEATLNGAMAIRGRNSSNTVAEYSNGAAATVAPALLSGVLAIAGQKGYRDGALDTSSIGAWSATNTSALYILCRNSSDTANGIVAASIQRLYIYNIDVSSYMAALVTAINS